MLAQVGQLPPAIAWSSFAPELAPTAIALALLLLAVAGRARLRVASGLAIGGVALGAWLITQELILPGAVAVILAIAVPALIGAFPRQPTLASAWISALSLLGALALTYWQVTVVLSPDTTAAFPPMSPLIPQDALQGSLANDGIALFTRITVYLSALLAIPIGYGYLSDRRLLRLEVDPLLLLAVVGMAAFATANDLITLFVSLEVLSIALYVLAGLARRDRRSQEAALKYFILGAVASAILLYGMALLYVATGSVALPDIGRQLGLVTTPPVVAGLGLVLVTVGIGFKVALAPFHLWTPDVYQGAPTNVTAFMAAATKAAGFAVVLRLYFVAFPDLQALWVPILAVLAAITMLYGAYVAVVQRDLKRMLAYSSITHAGYATIGVVAHSEAGLSATLWYLLTYAVATLAAFGCVVALERLRRGEVTLADLRGLGRTSPALAGILSLSLLSLAGIPATAGFVGKLVVFQAGVAAGFAWLVVIGVASSVIAAFFYLRIVGTMFLEEPVAGSLQPVVTAGLSAGMSVAVALVVFLGLQPALFLELARNAVVLVR